MGCGCRPEEVDHMVVRRSAGGWRIYVMGKAGEVVRLMEESYSTSGMAQGEADALGMSVPVLIR